MINDLITKVNENSKKMETSIIIQDTTNDIAEFSIIRSKIHEIRGQIVMLDFDLAEEYEIETRVLKQSVRRNISRFYGDDFMFQLSNNEVFELSRSQNVTLNKGRGSNIKYPPFAFTELGIAMLSSVVNSEKAIDTNRKIMRAFVAIRKYILNYAEIKQDLEDFKTETKEQIGGIYNVLDELISRKQEQEKPRTPIGFKQKSNQK
jgi:hypothetical protein